MRPLVQRLPSKRSVQQGIILYGVDNLYPERVLEISLRSPITKSALEVTDEFLHGEGFTLNPEFLLGEKPVSRLLLEQTPNFTLYKTPTAIFDVNLLGEITNVAVIPFWFVRLMPPNKENKITFCKVSPDWLDQNVSRRAKTYPLWPGNKEEAVKVIEDWNYESAGEFPGFVSYDTPIKTTYPLAFIDSVLDSAQTNSEIQIFELAGIQNGFLSATLLKHLGKISGDEERSRITQQVQGMTGAENANSVVVWEVPEGYDGNVLEQFPANNQDRLFEATNRTSVNRIVQSMAIPPQLLGIFPDSGFFTSQEITEAYTYYNTITRRRRKVLSDWFNMVGLNFETPVQFGELKELSYALPSEPSTTPAP